MNAFLITSVLLAGAALLWAVLLTLQVHEHARYVRACLRNGPYQWHAPPRVLVCVPCKGLDLDLANNLRCVLSQDYPNYQVRFVVEDAADPAHAVIKRLIATSPVSCELLVAGTGSDTGQKVHNLRCATAELPDDLQVLTFFDSDARPAPDALARLVDRLWRGGLQAATGYRWFVPQRPSLANLTLASINAAVASLLNHQGWNLVWGGGWAVTRDLFEKTALADAWQGTLSDDLVASRVLRAAGAKVAFEPGCMAASAIDVTWKEAATFLHRQFVISRCYAPLWWWGAVPLVLLQPVVLLGGLALAPALAWQGSSLWFLPLLVSAALYLLAVLRGRWRQATWSSRVHPVSDALQAGVQFDHWAAPWNWLFAAGTMLASAFGRSITWRGIRYHIGPAGRITSLGRVLDAQQRRDMIAMSARQREKDKAVWRLIADSEEEAAVLSVAASSRKMEPPAKLPPPRRVA